MIDSTAIIWKEWREQVGQRGLRGRQGVLLFLTAFGIVLPLMNGPSWITSPMTAVVWSWVPMFLVTTVIADAFAGERERHTLETLLASRLSDHAILFGKIGAAIGYAGAMTAASLVLGLLTINIKSAATGVVFYTWSAVAAMVTVGLLGALFTATVGVLISLRASTVKQAQQTLGGVIMVLLLLPMLAARWIPVTWKTALVSSHLSGLQLVIIGALLLAALDAGVVSLALIRFKRARLITVLVALLLCPVRSPAQARAREGLPAGSDSRARGLTSPPQAPRSSES
jgi:ABC-2 type transport system permease protein